MKGRVNLTEGSVSQSITKMALPMMVGMFSMAAFNIADTYFVGKIGTAALAAMGFTLPVVMLQGTISMGLGVGASSVISQAIGKKDENLVKRLTTDALILSVLLVIVSVVVGILTIDPLFRALGATPELLPLLHDYMFYWYLGVPFVVIPMVGNNAMRATGNTTIPSAVMITAVIVNIILDPLLIFGIGPFPEWGLKGAAIATVISRATTFVVSLLFLHFKFNMLTRHVDSFHEVLSSWKKIGYIATPTALTQVLVPLMMAYTTRIVASYGEAAVAGVGVATKIEMFAMFPLMSLGSVIVPFIGQNLGAKRFDRIEEGRKFANKSAMIFGGLIFVLFFLLGENFTALFDKSSEVINIGGAYLAIISVSYGLFGVSAIGGSIFSALNKPLNAMALNIIRLIVLTVPFTYFGSKIFGLQGVFFGIVITNIVSGIIVLFWVKGTVVKLEK